ncbi:MAG: hypothetical protein ACFCU8_17030 [Thermosynechococcaceae cyanobacterium]
MEEDKEFKVKRKAGMLGAMALGGVSIMLAEKLFPLNNLISFCASLMGALIGARFCYTFPGSVLFIASLFGPKARDFMVTLLERDRS